eukprot:Pgem_evm1s6588
MQRYKPEKVDFDYNAGYLVFDSSDDEDLNGDEQLVENEALREFQEQIAKEELGEIENLGRKINASFIDHNDGDYNINDNNRPNIINEKKNKNNFNNNRKNSHTKSPGIGFSNMIDFNKENEHYYDNTNEIEEYDNEVEPINSNNYVEQNKKELEELQQRMSQLEKQQEAKHDSHSGSQIKNNEMDVDFETQDQKENQVKSKAKRVHFDISENTPSQSYLNNKKYQRNNGKEQDNKQDENKNKNSTEYDSVYFTSSDESNGNDDNSEFREQNETKGNSKHNRDGRQKKSDADLFYDDSIDERNEKWVQKERAKHTPRLSEKQKQK